VVSQVVGTMGEINSSASKIADIIGVIDGIAFQTNILALNAAVEAARAGEQGRGFAVVASEVRNLAQRSAAAAKEIKTLIGDSVEKIGRGSKLVGQAGVTMDEVVDSVKRVTNIMSEIANASAEQSAGIEQVNLSIIEMDGMTQQNAALVEQAAAAFQSLQDQAAELQRVVSIFKLAEGEQAAAEAPALAAASTAVATRAVVARPARRPAASPQLKKSAAARKAASTKADEAQAPAADSGSSTSKKVAAAAAGDDWEEF
jgi:methyl-accepting chemotaxis protein